MLFKITFLTTFISNIRLYDQMWQNLFLSLMNKLKITNFNSKTKSSYERIFANFGYVIICILSYRCCKFHFSSFFVPPKKPNCIRLISHAGQLCSLLKDLYQCRRGLAQFRSIISRKGLKYAKLSGRPFFTQENVWKRRIKR